MTISYVSPDGFEKKLNMGYNYFLPIDAKIVVSDCEYITVNDKRKMLDSNSFAIDYAGEDLDLEYNGRKFLVRSYGQKLDENVRYEYVQFADNLNGIISVENNNISSDRFVDILNHDLYNLNLCTFGRNVEEMRSDKSLEEILVHMKHLKQVFMRPKSHLREEMELLPVEVVTRISHETIQHLASHSENCEARRVNGLVPSRLLAKSLEEDWAIYENVVAKNLVDRLYAYIKKYKRNVSLAEHGTNYSLSVKNEDRNVHVAQARLYKGFISTEDSAYDGDTDFLSLRKKQCSEILATVVFCRESKLYRKLKKCKKSYSPLKSTNIFMMDTNYNSIYKLWRILDQAEFNTDKVNVSSNINKPYFDFVYSLLNFSLNNFNFSPKTNFLVQEHGFTDAKYSFKHWNVNLNTIYIDKIGLNAIEMDFSIEDRYTMPYHFDGDAKCVIDCVVLDKNNIVFNKIPNNDEIEEICLDIFPNRHARDSLAASHRRDLRQAIIEFFRGKRSKHTTVLLLPIPIAVCQTEKEFTEAFEHLRLNMQSIIDAYRCCYFVLPQRPSDNEDLSKKEWSKHLIEYPELQTNEKFGVLPVTLNDIDSYRRLTKILLRHMVALDEEHKFCPICGTSLIFDNGTWQCNNCAPAFSIRKPICHCGKEYMVTHYNKSHSFSEHDSIEGTNVYETLEIKGGFKNFTAIDNDLKPICPYCKER